jgi:autotransporter adhesin
MQGYAYTNNVANALRGQISEVQRSSNQGTAAAVAMLTSIKTPTPGKSAVSLGGGYYGGQAGVALSASHRSRDSRWHSAAAIGVPVTISNGQNIAAGGSVGFEF